MEAKAEGVRAGVEKAAVAAAREGVGRGVVGMVAEVRGQAGDM